MTESDGDRLRPTPPRGSAIWIVLVVAFLLGAGLNVSVAATGSVMWPLGVSMLAVVAAGRCLLAWIREDRRVRVADVDGLVHPQAEQRAKHR